MWKNDFDSYLYMYPMRARRPFERDLSLDAAVGVSLFQVFVEVELAEKLDFSFPAKITRPQRIAADFAFKRRERVDGRRKSLPRRVENRLKLGSVREGRRCAVFQRSQALGEGRLKSVVVG